MAAGLDQVDIQGAATAVHPLHLALAPLAAVVVAALPVIQTETVPLAVLAAAGLSISAVVPVLLAYRAKVTLAVTATRAEA